MPGKHVLGMRKGWCPELQSKCCSGGWFCKRSVIGTEAQHVCPCAAVVQPNPDHPAHLDSSSAGTTTDTYFLTSPCIAMFVFLYYYLTSRFKIVFIWLGSPLSRIAKRFTRGLWVGEVERLERRLEESNSELELTRSRSREAQQSKELLQRRVDQLSGRVDKTEYERVLRENNDLRAHLGMVEADARQRTADFERAIARATKKHGDLEGLLEARSKELQEAQAYVTKLDEVADSEVVGIVEPLNGQIFQAAASLTDVEEFHFDNPCKDSATVAGAKSRLATSSWVGSELLDVLGDWSHVEHSVFVQLAIQAGLATYARQVANSWDPTNTRDTTILESLYALIRERGTWRRVRLW